MCLLTTNSGQSDEASAAKKLLVECHVPGARRARIRKARERDSRHQPVYFWASHYWQSPGRLGDVQREAERVAGRTRGNKKESMETVGGERLEEWNLASCHEGRLHWNERGPIHCSQESHSLSQD